MQHCCLQTNCLQCNLLLYKSNNGCRRTLVELIASVGCRQMNSSIGCSISFCIQIVWSSCNRNKAKLYVGICAANLNASIGCRSIVASSDAAYLSTLVPSNGNSLAKGKKHHINITKVGNLLKARNTRSCIQFCFRNLGLHPTNIFCNPVCHEDCWQKLDIVWYSGEAKVQSQGVQHFKVHTANETGSGIRTNRLRVIFNKV